MANKTVKDVMAKPKPPKVKVNYNGKSAGSFNMGTNRPFQMKVK